MALWGRVSTDRPIGQRLANLQISVEGEGRPGIGSGEERMV